jgi:hypothetical protein
MVSSKNDRKGCVDLKIKKVRQWIADLVYPEYVNQINSALNYSEKYHEDALNYKHLLEQERKEFDKLNSITEDLNQEVYDLQDKLNELTYTRLEEWLSIKYKEVSKFAYKEKRKYLNIKYSVYPNEMIQPDKYLVVKARNEIGYLSKDLKNAVHKIGKYVDNQLTWKADIDTTGMLDFYHSSCESLVSKKVDCDSHCFLASSLDHINIGVAFGFCGKTAHAFNIFIYENELWCMETNTTANYSNAGNTKVFKYDGQSLYKIHEIFTKDRSFIVDNSVVFGIKER